MVINSLNAGRIWRKDLKKCDKCDKCDECDECPSEPVILADENAYAKQDKIKNASLVAV